MKIKLKEDLFYNKLDNLVCMNKSTANNQDYELLYNVIN